MKHGHGTFSWPNEKRIFIGNFANDQIFGNGFMIKQKLNSKSPEMEWVALGEFYNEGLQGYGAKLEYTPKGLIISVGSQWQTGNLKNGWVLNEAESIVDRVINNTIAKYIPLCTFRKEKAL